MNKLIGLAVMAWTAWCGGAFGVTLPSLPDGEFADAEFSTNIPFRVEASRLQEIRFALELAASATNGLEVAVGCDANEDGRLSVEESDVVFGYDCGRWFVRDSAADAESSCLAMATGTIRREFVIRSRALRPNWDLAKVTRRGRGALGETVSLVFDGKKFRLILR